MGSHLYRFSHIKDRELKAALAEHPEFKSKLTEAHLKQRVQEQTQKYQDALQNIQGQSYLVHLHQHELEIRQTLESSVLNTLSLHDTPLPGDTPYHRWGEHIVLVDSESTDYLETLYWKPHDSLGLSTFKNTDNSHLQSMIFSHRLENLNHLPLSRQLMDPRIYGLEEQAGPYDFFLGLSANAETASLLFVSDRSLGDIYLIDTENYKMKDVFTLRDHVSTHPLMLAPDIDQQKVYYIEASHPNLGILDYQGGTLEELSLDHTGYNLNNIAFHGDLLYVLSEPQRQLDAPTLHVLNTQSWDTLEILSLPMSLYSQHHDCAANPMSLSPDGKHLVLLTGENPHTEVLWLNTETLEIVERQIVPGHPFPVQIAFGLKNPLQPHRQNLAQLLILAEDIREDALLEMFPLEEDDCAVDLVFPEDIDEKSPPENEGEASAERTESAGADDEEASAQSQAVLHRHRQQKKNQKDAALLFLSPIERLQSLPDAQPAEEIVLPKSAQTDILQILTGSFYQHFEVDLEEHPPALQRLRAESEALRKKLQAYSLLPVIIDDLLPGKTLKTILLRESILTLQAIHNTPDKNLYETPPSHCPACQSPLLGNWDCETCGMELMSPQRYQARKHTSAHSQTWLPPDYFAISDSQSGRLLLVDTQRYQYVTWQMDFRKLPELTEPWDMLWLENLHFLVTDKGGNQVVECTQGGRERWSYQPIDDNHVLNKPVYSTLYKNENGQKRYLVVDQGNHRILEVDSEHRVHWEYGESPLPDVDLAGKPEAVSEDPESWPENSLYKPTCVQYTPQQSYLITDTGRNRVIEVKNDRIIQTWGSKFQLQAPVAAQRLLNGKTLIVDAGNQRILEMDQDEIWRETEYYHAGMDPRFHMLNPQKVIRRDNQNVVLIDTNRVMEIDPLSKRIVWFSFLHDLRLEVELPTHLKPVRVKVPTPNFEKVAVVTPENMSTLRRSLEQVKLFRGARVAFFERLEKAMRFKRFEAGTWILQKGQMGKQFYVLQSGKADVYAAENEPPLSLQAGESFGLMGIVYPEPRKSDVKAVSDCGVYLLDKKRFDDIIKDFPDIAERVKQRAQERLVVLRLRQTPKSSQAQERLAALMAKQRAAAQARLERIHPQNSEESKPVPKIKIQAADENTVCDIDAQKGHLDHRLNYTDIERRVMEEATKENQSTLEIHIQFKPAARMKLARVSLLVSMMNRMGTLIRTHPEPDKITSGQFDNELIFSLITHHAKEELYEDLSTLSDISSVYIFEVLVSS